MRTHIDTAPLLRELPCEALSDVGRATDSLPLQLALSVSGQLAVARWHNPVVSAQLEPPDRHMLIFHERGSTAIEAQIGSLQGHGSRIGSVTVVPAGVTSRWRLHGACDVIHVYLEPSRLRSAEGIVQTLAPAFASQNDWLQQWFALLSAQMTALQRHGDSIPALLADEFEGLLVSHLLSDMQPSNSPRGGLPGGAMRRIDEFLRARLSDELRLADLAELTHLSAGHFIKAFRQTAGCTPWQYVLDLRLESAAALLREGVLADDVARRVGLTSSTRLSRLFRDRRSVTLSELKGQRTRAS
jgi:AraC family transcriptional regulator